MDVSCPVDDLSRQRLPHGAGLPSSAAFDQSLSRNPTAAPPDPGFTSIRPRTDHLVLASLPRRRPRRSSSVEPRSAAVASAPQPLRTPVTINSIARVTARSLPCSFQLASGAHQCTRTRALALTGMSVWNSYRVDAWPERHSSALCCERGAVRYLVGAGGDRGLTVMPRFASSSMTIFAFGLPASASFLVSDASVSSV